MVKIVTVGLQKGGVGKTTTALHLAFYAAEKGLKVLLADLDTQASASILLTGSVEAATQTDKGEMGSDRMFHAPLRMAPVQVKPHLWLLSGHMGLDSLDLKLAESRALKDMIAIREELLKTDYDLIVCDTPPAVGMRQVSPIIWADHVVTPIEPSVLAVTGLHTYTRTRQQVEKFIHRPIGHSLVIGRWQKNTRRQQEIIEDLEKKKEWHLISPYLANRVAVADAIAEGKPVWAFAGAADETKTEWKTAMKHLLARCMAEPAKQKQVA